MLQSSEQKNPPIIVIHGNLAKKLPVSYKRYLMNYYRKSLKIMGTPIRIEFRETSNPFAGKKKLNYTQCILERVCILQIVHIITSSYIIYFLMSSYRVRTIHIPGLHAHVCYVLSVVLSKSYFRVCIEIPTVGIQFFATTLESMHSIISSISTTVRLKYCRNNT